MRNAQALTTLTLIILLWAGNSRHQKVNCHYRRKLVQKLGFTVSLLSACIAAGMSVFP